MLDKNQRVRDEFKCWKLNIKKHGEFIAELITGKPGDSSPQVSMLCTLHSNIFTPSQLSNVHIINFSYVCMYVCMYV